MRAGRLGRSPTKCRGSSSIPTSSLVSLMAVSSNVRSVCDLWPPGKAICPDQGSPSRSTLLINSTDAACEVLIIIATAASDAFEGDKCGVSRSLRELRSKATDTLIHLMKNLCCKFRCT